MEVSVETVVKIFMYNPSCLYEVVCLFLGSLLNYYYSLQVLYLGKHIYKQTHVFHPYIIIDSTTVY